ncbi:hypothetical protein CLOP_g4460 [Closterium sp. NIES-67]|nr:hypothetical protein CLOP_g4460 [Closterium sp. NIES-67]
MGSFNGHAFAGSVALLVAFWSLRCAIRDFLAAPHAYVARAWHPVPIRGHWTRLAVYILVGGTFAQLVEGLCLGLMSALQRRLDIVQFEHAMIFVVFVIIGLIFCVHDTTSLLPLPPGSLHILWALGFFSEAVLTAFHSISHQGLEPRYHVFQAIAALACFLLALLVAACPSSFLLDVLFSSGVLFQGMWLWTMALSLYGVLQLPGCRNVDYKMVKCATEAEEHVAVAVADLQFITVLVLTALLVLALYARAARSAPRSSIQFILASREPHSSKGSSWEGVAMHVEGGTFMDGGKAVLGEAGGATAAPLTPPVIAPVAAPVAATVASPPAATAGAAAEGDAHHAVLLAHVVGMESESEGLLNVRV